METKKQLKNYNKLMKNIHLEQKKDYKIGDYKMTKKEILKSFIKDNETFVNEKITKRILNRLTHRELTNISLEIIMRGEIIK